MKFVIVGCLCAGALAATGCADGPGLATGPSASGVTPRLTALSAAPRSGELHVKKECSQFNGNAGEFCTITSSNVKEIEAGARVIYATSNGPTALDTDVVLDAPGPGNNKAVGHCHVEFSTLSGVCTFSGGTGKFTHFQASAQVSYVSGFDWAWDGTYSFEPQN